MTNSISTGNLVLSFKEGGDQYAVLPGIGAKIEPQEMPTRLNVHAAPLVSVFRDGVDLGNREDQKQFSLNTIMAAALHATEPGRLNDPDPNKAEADKKLSDRGVAWKVLATIVSKLDPATKTGLKKLLSA